MNQPSLASWLRPADRHPQLAQPGDGDAPEVGAEVDQDRRHRPQLDHRGEAGAGVVPAEQRRDDPQVAAGGDRQELGQPLDEAEDEGFEGVHGGASYGGA